MVNFKQLGGSARVCSDIEQGSCHQDMPTECGAGVLTSNHYYFVILCTPDALQTARNEIRHTGRSHGKGPLYLKLRAHIIVGNTLIIWLLIENSAY